MHPARAFPAFRDSRLIEGDARRAGKAEALRPMRLSSTAPACPWRIDPIRDGANTFFRRRARRTSKGLRLGLLQGHHDPLTRAVSVSQSPKVLRTPSRDAHLGRGAGRSPCARRDPLSCGDRSRHVSVTASFRCRVREAGFRGCSARRPLIELTEVSSGRVRLAFRRLGQPPG